MWFGQWAGATAGNWWGDGLAPVVVPEVKPSGGYFTRHDLTKKQRKKLEKEERIRLGIIPPDAPPAVVVEVVARESVYRDWSEQFRLMRLRDELKARGRELNAAYLQSFEMQLREFQQRKRNQDAIALLLLS